MSRLRLLPRSLLGQMILLMALALLVAQLANLAFILNEQQKLNLAQNEGPAIARFVERARQLVSARARDGDWRAVAQAGPEYSVTPRSPIGSIGEPRSRELERRLAESLAAAGIETRSVEAASRIEIRQRRHGGDGASVSREQKVAWLSAQLSDGAWLNGRLDVARPDFWLVHRLIFATLLLYLIVLGAAAWAAIRLGRPVRDLAVAAERFQGQEDPRPIEPRGPGDVRRAIHAFNAMSARVTALLDQKDRMLGAIGHDLRTPLASIRIRAENMGPESERSQLFAAVDEMAEMLEDILVLARTGRPREPVQRVDLAALADAVVEEFRELGKEARFIPSPRIVLDVQPGLLRRALRNLVENGIVHGGSASVAVEQDGDDVGLVVRDEGPGIPPEHLDEVRRPFARLDPSRSSRTGGAGLGLAIAQAVAEAHGGRLELDNRDEGGLCARLVLPRPSPASR